MKDREAWHAVVHGVSESDTAERLSDNSLLEDLLLALLLLQVASLQQDDLIFFTWRLNS